MTAAERITLTAAWGKRPKGSVLRVWTPGVALAADVVDPVRAAQLLADDLAVEGIPEPAKTSKKGAA